MDKRAVLCYLHSHPGQRPRKCTTEGQEIYLSFAPAMKTQVEQLRMQTPFPSDLTSGMSPPLSEPVFLVCKRGVITSWGYLRERLWSRLVWVCVCVWVAQSYPILCDPMDYSPPGSSVHGILQARILAWVAIPFSRGIFLTQGSPPVIKPGSPSLQADSSLVV